jgi:ribonuclease HII
VAAAAIVPASFSLYASLNDSKKLTEARRETLFAALSEECQHGVGIVSAEEIDAMNILKATFLAMQRAYEAMGCAVQLALVDGNRPPALDCRVQTVVKGDSRSASIAGASVLAKVTRDRMMQALDGDWPAYGFGAHKGYGTATHRSALEQHGVTPHHRRSYAPIRALLENAA